MAIGSVIAHAAGRPDFRRKRHRVVNSEPPSTSSWGERAVPLGPPTAELPGATGGSDRRTGDLLPAHRSHSRPGPFVRSVLPCSDGSRDVGTTSVPSSSWDSITLDRSPRGIRLRLPRDHARSAVNVSLAYRLSGSVTTPQLGSDELRTRARSRSDHVESDTPRLPASDRGGLDKRSTDTEDYIHTIVITLVAWPPLGDLRPDLSGEIGNQSISSDLAHTRPSGRAGGER